MKIGSEPLLISCDGEPLGRRVQLEDPNFDIWDNSEFPRAVSLEVSELLKEHHLLILDNHTLKSEMQTALTNVGRPMFWHQDNSNLGGPVTVLHKAADTGARTGETHYGDAGLIAADLRKRAGEINTKLDITSNWAEAETDAELLKSLSTKVQELVRRTRGGYSYDLVITDIMNSIISENDRHFYCHTWSAEVPQTLIVHGDDESRGLKSKTFHGRVPNSKIEGKASLQFEVCQFTDPKQGWLARFR